MTTKESLSKHLERIAFNDLSVTFQDAVNISRSLGQRYLWIDSLCILQCNAQDWEVEASQMASVYNCSLYTLCALSSDDSSQGCRVNGNKRNTQNSSPYLDLDIGDFRIRFFKGTPQYWHQEYGDDPYKFEGYGNKCENPLSTRAWTLQERELSRRKIHFPSRLLLWECCTLKASSELPWQMTEFIGDRMPDPLLLNDPEGLARNGGAKLRDNWYSIVEDYSSIFLTKEHDKLPALSSLAQRFQTHFGSSHYIAGMWTEHLPNGLLWQNASRWFEGDFTRWYSAFQPRRPMLYRAPSWYWALLDGAVTYQSQRLAGGSTN